MSKRVVFKGGANVYGLCLMFWWDHVTHSFDEQLIKTPTIFISVNYFRNQQNQFNPISSSEHALWLPFQTKRQPFR